ncbi:cold-shock protein [uncultured Sulfitobacter sp.]|uniref:cold-shock protein n=1 Tax=uncultured Sulfitobacter sp. TaxID=191468 RepID=UPI002635BD88|nr:cold shock domain-containing protein [uncultured Sulfitobacter sp.]
MIQAHDDNTPQSGVNGTVKWFDPVKGFGFVVSDDGGVDILLHVNVLRNFGQSSVADGSRVAMVVQKTERGAQASEILSISPPEGVQTSLPDIAGLDKEQIASTPLLAARIKWFDKAKGFGFANVFGCPEDVFVHMDVLRQSGLSDLAPGEAIAMRVIDGKRGRMAAEVLAWETVPTTEELSSQG